MRNPTIRFAVAAAVGLLALGAAGTASATMITGSPGSITADRTSSDDLVEHKLQRDTSTLYRPLDSAVTISGNLDISGIESDGSLFVGLVDADFYDNNQSDEYKTYQSGAYGYFAPGSNGGAGNFGPTDGNDGGEVIQESDSLNGNTDVDFSLTINPDGTLSVTYAGQTVTDSYGDVKSRFDDDPYSAAEFANGGYLSVEFASSHGTNGPETVAYNLNVTGNGATDVPEPSELGLLGLGALMIAGGLVFRRRKSPFAG